MCEKVAESEIICAGCKQVYHKNCNTGYLKNNCELRPCQTCLEFMVESKDAIIKSLISSVDILSERINVLEENNKASKIK